MFKNLISAFIFSITCFGTGYAVPTGMAFDPLLPSPLSDPDLTSDMGALTPGLAISSGDTSDITFNFNYHLRSTAPNKSISLSFIVSQSEYSKNNGDHHDVVDGQCVELDVIWSRSLMKIEKSPNDWRPALFSISWYYGLGLGNVSTDVRTSSTVDKKSLVLDIFPSDSTSVRTNTIPLFVGAYLNGRLTRRFGYEVYGDLRQYLLISDGAYKSNMTPTLNLGTNLCFLRKPAGYFPMDIYTGFAFVMRNNSAEDGIGIGLNFGFRKRW